MKKFFLVGTLFALACLAACDSLAPWLGGSGNTGSQRSLPRVAIAGLAIESSTFSPARSDQEAFRAKRGDEVFTRYRFYAEGSPVMARAEYFPALTGKAIPGGMVTREAYESLMRDMLHRLEQNTPYDGLFLDLHGAMSVEGLDDAEGDLISRVRKVVGDDTLISTSMDLHGNVSWALAIGGGGEIDATAGADVDDRYAPPVRLKGTIRSISQDDPDAEVEVVVRVGSIDVIVTKMRKPYHYAADFERVGLRPKEADIVIVKIGYLVPELYDMRGDWLMALTPGGVDQHLERLEYKRIQRPMFPFDKDMADPDLAARMVPLSHLE